MTSNQSDEFELLHPAHKDLVPPWEKFPTYEYYSIGWRMGHGEYYKSEWWKFLESLPSNYQSRLQYLRRNRPAPINRFNQVLWVLYPDDDRYDEYQDYEDSQEEITYLLELGLIQYDAAFETWLQQQTEICFPWELSETPEEAVRYWTREFWFFARQFNRNRNIKIPKIPYLWKDVEYNLVSGKLGEIDPNGGLKTLAKMFCAGNVLTPWELGLKLEDFQDSFEMDMGYSDAYKLWLMSAFDDDKLIRQMWAKTQIPKEWIEWTEERIEFIFC